jgi:hypothetical protein
MPSADTLACLKSDKMWHRLGRGASRIREQPMRRPESSSVRHELHGLGASRGGDTPVRRVVNVNLHRAQA